MSDAWEIRGDYALDVIEQRRPLLGWTFEPRDARDPFWKRVEQLYALVIYFGIAFLGCGGLIGFAELSRGWPWGDAAFLALVVASVVAGLGFVAFNYFVVAGFINRIKDNALVRDNTIHWWWLRTRYPVVVRGKTDGQGKLEVTWLVNRDNAKIVHKSRHEAKPSPGEGMDERPLAAGKARVGDQGVGVELTRPAQDAPWVHVHLRARGASAQAQRLTLEVAAEGWLEPHELEALPVLQGRGVRVDDDGRAVVLEQLLPTAQALGATLPPAVQRALVRATQPVGASVRR